MDNLTYKTLKESLPSSNITIEKTSNCIIFTITNDLDISKTYLYDIFPNLHLIFFDVHAHSLSTNTFAPGKTFNLSQIHHPVHFNYCLEGRIELMLDDDSYIYLAENDFCISCQKSQSDSYFPSKRYRGITLYFDPEFFYSNKTTLSTLFEELDCSRLPKIYFNEKNTYIAKSEDKMRHLLKQMWHFAETSSIFHMQLCILELLHLLLDTPKLISQKPLIFYTNVQVEIAKKTETLLTTDLTQHIPLKSLASQFGISESSLKNYFRGVYGKNVSDYLKDLRLNTAEKLLTQTELPISEIASQVGYTKQGKFAEVFRKKFQMNPLEYRHYKRLENL